MPVVGVNKSCREKLKRVEKNILAMNFFSSFMHEAQEWDIVRELINVDGKFVDGMEVFSGSTEVKFLVCRLKWNF